MVRGKFIVFEGLDGCGKDTQIELLSKYLKEKEINHVIKSNVCDNEIGQVLRKSLSDKDLYAGSLQSACLFMASMFSLDKEITPILDNGTHVICSRHYVSTLVYGPKESKHVDAFWSLAESFKSEPDIIIYLRLEPEAAIARRATRKEAYEVYEDTRIQKRLFDNFETFLSMRDTIGDSNIIVIDASESIETMHSKIVSRLETL